MGDVFQILSENGIPAFIVGRNGRRNVRLDYGQGKNVFLRQEQFRFSWDRIGSGADEGDSGKSRLVQKREKCSDWTLWREIFMSWQKRVSFGVERESATEYEKEFQIL